MEWTDDADDDTCCLEEDETDEEDSECLPLLPTLQLVTPPLLMLCALTPLLLL